MRLTRTVDKSLMSPSPSASKPGTQSQSQNVGLIAECRETCTERFKWRRSNEFSSVPTRCKSELRCGGLVRCAPRKLFLVRGEGERSLTGTSDSFASDGRRRGVDSTRHPTHLRTRNNSRCVGSSLSVLQNSSLQSVVHDSHAVIVT